MNIKIQRNVLIIVIVALLVVGYIGWSKIQSLGTKLTMSEQNTKALTDSVRVSKTKNGKLEYSINVMVAEKGDLAKLNKTLADEVAKERGKIHELMAMTGHVTLTDTIYLTNTLMKYSNGIYGLKWSYDTAFDAKNSRSIAGESGFRQDTIKTMIDGKEIVGTKIEPLLTRLTKDEVKFNLVVGLRDKDKNIEIFARSDYPNLVITDLQGAIIDPKTHPVLKQFNKTKRWGVGPYVGVGIGTDLKFMPQIGIGVTFSLIRF